MSTLKERFDKEIREKLKQELGLSNRLAAPCPLKVVVNMGVGVAKDDHQLLNSYREDLRQLTGQQPVVRKAKKAEAGFKLRKGEGVGLLVTLRGQRMWNFLEKLSRVVLPRLRDFRGLGWGGFDGHGNYHLGIEEHGVFPELNPAKSGRLKSLGINIVTSANQDKAAALLLGELGFPFRREK